MTRVTAALLRHEHEGEGGLMPTLREVRLEHYLTQRELAEKAGIAESTVATIEAGRHRPRLPTARVLAAALGRKPGEIDWPPAPTEEPPADAEQRGAMEL